MPFHKFRMRLIFPTGFCCESSRADSKFNQLLIGVIGFILCFYSISAKATEEYELARKKVASFINASDSSEIVFTRNATEAINLVAYSWGLQNLKPEDEVHSPSLIYLFIDISISFSFLVNFFASE